MEAGQRRKVIFYGDSNTYGYDPAHPYECRFPSAQRWTAIVSRHFQSELKVIPEGMNGRRIPDVRYEQSYLRELLDSTGDSGLFCMMLGTNDILSTMEPDAGEAVRRMDSCQEYLLRYLKPGQILIIAPPPVGSAEDPDPVIRGYFTESVRMNVEFGKMAGARGIGFADAAGWGIELSYDQVHFSAEGHRVFAEKMTELLELIQTDSEAAARGQGE